MIGWNDVAHMLVHIFLLVFDDEFVALHNCRSIVDNSKFDEVFAQLVNDKTLNQWNYQFSNFFFSLPLMPWAKCSSQNDGCDALSERLLFASVHWRICTSNRIVWKRHPDHRSISAHISWCNCREPHRWSWHPSPSHSEDPLWRLRIYSRAKCRQNNKNEGNENIYLYFTRTISFICKQFDAEMGHTHAYWQLSNAVITLLLTFSKLEPTSWIATANETFNFPQRPFFVSFFCICMRFAVW